MPTDNPSPPSHPPSGSIFPSLIPSTPGVQSIEAAYTRAGAKSTHTPAAGSKMGSAEAEGRKEVERKVLESRKEVGSGSAAGVRNEPSMVGQMINSMLNGDKK